MVVGVSDHKMQDGGGMGDRASEVVTGHGLAALLRAQPLNPSVRLMFSTAKTRLPKAAQPGVLVSWVREVGQYTQIEPGDTPGSLGESPAPVGSTVAKAHVDATEVGV